MSTSTKETRDLVAQLRDYCDRIRVAFDPAAIVAALLHAADVADQQTRPRDAVLRAWSALHHDRDAMGPAFAAWSLHERGTTSDIPSMGGMLMRRYKEAGPAGVAASLRAAAEAVTV